MKVQTKRSFKIKPFKHKTELEGLRMTLIEKINDKNQIIRGTALNMPEHLLKQLTINQGRFS